MTLTLWLTFLIAAVLISVSPGAGAVNTMSNGVRFGVKRSLPAILGLQLGYGAQIVLVGAGLGRPGPVRPVEGHATWTPDHHDVAVSPLLLQ